MLTVNGTAVTTPKQPCLDNPSVLLSDNAAAGNLSEANAQTPTNAPARRQHDAIGVQESQAETFQNQRLRKSPLLSEEHCGSKSQKSILASQQMSDVGPHLTQNYTQ